LVGPDRSDQLEYSNIQQLMQDEAHRRGKARKVIAVLEHFLGGSLAGQRVLDLGSSAGFVSSEIARHGAHVVGSDIDRPGLARATVSFGHEVAFVCARGERLPFSDGALDVVVFNHIYEHTIDPVPVMQEIERVLRPGGAVYLGLVNRLGVIEPHHRLPFLSYLPPALADRYVRLSGRGDRYHERLRTRPALRRLAGGLTVWDYTISVMAEPSRFAADDVVHGWRAHLPARALSLATPFIPTYLWIGVKGERGPVGPALAVPPRRVPTPVESS
jgi:SAM-dependent methyltransferase